MRCCKCNRPLQRAVALKDGQPVGPVCAAGGRHRLHPQNVWRTVHALLLAEECHVCGMGEATRPRARPPYIFARGAPGPDAIAPTKPQDKQRPRDLPKRDALTVGLFGSA